MQSQGDSETPARPLAEAHPRFSPERRLRALLLLIAVLLGSWTLWSTVVLPRLQPVDGLAYSVRSVGVRLALWVLPCGIYLWSQHRSRALVPLQLGPPPTFRHLLVSFGMILAASLAVSIDVARKLDLSPLQVWVRLVTEFELRFPTAPFFEELTFRGVILSDLVRVLSAPAGGKGGSEDLPIQPRFWLGNLAASAVFTGLHWPWWVYTNGLAAPIFWQQTAGVFFISLVLGMLFVRSRSLWPCVVLHWVNNELSGLVPGPS